ncbi:MAG: hypothetical protein CM15mL5_1390 [uncultured marine virus]|nr:MAG: hypothetical protein CM15mL5_1390 [uncultured marine virus]
MPDIIDLIAQDSKASDISSEIKDSLYAKAAEKIEALRGGVSNAMFDEPQVEDEVEDEVETENELETETEEEPEESE